MTPNKHRRRSAPLGRVPATGQGARGAAPVRRARGRLLRQRGGGGEQEQREEQAGARTAGMEADRTVCSTARFRPVCTA